MCGGSVSICTQKNSKSCLEVLPEAVEILAGPDSAYSIGADSTPTLSTALALTQEMDIDKLKQAESRHGYMCEKEKGNVPVKCTGAFQSS